jgi:YfiH family protein
MAQNRNEPTKLTNSAFELVNWSPLCSTANQLHEKVLAFQTTRFSLEQLPSLAPNSQTPSTTLLSTAAHKSHNQVQRSEKSPFDFFNLGLHVNDSAEKVKSNRNKLQQFITQQLINTSMSDVLTTENPVNVQWLEQVHGNDVAEIMEVSSKAIIADASITREHNIALAIMTADCLPILLSNKKGSEVAAIHGGWRSLAANIITNTLNKMLSDPSDVVAWLGPCISKDAFEVGYEVRAEFIKQGAIFDCAFSKQENGKYLADLHKVAQLQLQLLGVEAISTLAECTYQRTDKYYSYRKNQVTGRMASVICRR